MRCFINIVEARSYDPHLRPELAPEPAPGVTTKLHDAPTFDFMPSLDKGALTTRTASDLAIPGRKSRRKVRARQLDPEVASLAHHHLSSLGAEDAISDTDAAQRAGVDMDAGVEQTVNVENLPAVISREVARTGGRVDPEWHQVKHLPGYLRSPIRAMGRAVFQQFTDTPIEDIQVITTLGGINPESDVVGMMGWIRHHGAQDHSAKLDFEQSMPGYSADTSLWRAKGYAFLLVHDFAGYYIYGWTSDGAKPLTPPPARRRLR